MDPTAAAGLAVLLSKGAFFALLLIHQRNASRAVRAVEARRAARAAAEAAAPLPLRNAA